MVSDIFLSGKELLCDFYGNAGGKTLLFVTEICKEPCTLLDKNFGLTLRVLLGFGLVINRLWLLI
jgi:hypothetical protein